MDPNVIAADGFNLGGLRRESLSDLALLSLRQGLRAYFTTYSAMRYLLHVFEDESPEARKASEYNHSIDYCDAASETIVHVQHFVELFIKRVLRSEHVLLADRASDDPVILHKLLKGEPLDDGERQGVQSLEFSRSFDRFCKLFEAGRLDRQAYREVYEARSWIRKLNELRNRIWHRGAYVLRYPALDRLMGEHVLPFVTSVTTLAPYADGAHTWKYPPLHCKVDPIDEIKKACQAGSYNLGRVAFVKELGRAAYASPVTNNAFPDLLANLIRGRLERAAREELNDSNVSEVLKCPVCGLMTLIVNDDTEVAEEVDGGLEFVRYTWQVACRACSFEVNHYLANPSEYGLPFPDYWKGTRW